MKVGIKNMANIFDICANPNTIEAIVRFFLVGIFVYLQNVYKDKNVKSTEPMSVVTNIAYDNTLEEKEYKSKANKPALIPYKSLAHRNTKYPNAAIKIRGTILEISRIFLGNVSFLS